MDEIIGLLDAGVNIDAIYKVRLFNLTCTFTKFFAFRRLSIPAMFYCVPPLRVTSCCKRRKV